MRAEPISVILKWITPDADKHIEYNARLCYGSPMAESDAKRASFLKNLKEMKHLSPFEHASFSFEIRNVSRVFTHQLVRHRLASYTQVSHRYTSLQNTKFIIPETVENNNLIYDVEELLERSVTLYNQLVESGVPKEDARYIIPHGVETAIVFTANFREMFQVMNLRLDRKAAWEIRTVVSLMASKLRELYPTLF